MLGLNRVTNLLVIVGTWPLKVALLFIFNTSGQALELI